MREEGAGPQIVARIGFAERWLARAKRQLSEGNVARGALTLVLADAEVRHALEAVDTGTVPRRSSAMVVTPILLVLATAAVIAAARIYAAPVERVDSGPAIVTLASPVGSLLALVPAPPPAPAPAPSGASRHAAPPVSTPAGAAEPLRRAAPAAGRPAGPAAVTPAPAPTVLPVIAASRSVVPAATAAPTMAAPVPVSPAVVQPTSPALLELSAGDLIDLVLAAERALRSGSVRR